LHPTHGSYVFSLSPAVSDFIGVYVWKRIGLITSADATGQDVERALNRDVELAGADI
jgi:hypothetical protein